MDEHIERVVIHFKGGTSLTLSPEEWAEWQAAHLNEMVNAQALGISESQGDALALEFRRQLGMAEQP